ncbi:MAG: hypothetical protein ETSY1_28690 [Candidatus Entotheonella factor]|uniref:Uncharacterized protein n=1 Tax=Entotheonella factor TaxID=1429438 RepID=W4LD47_ENTF1|nr:MAG: hypothetical protein ETSY1_28690 [Candidatus Entotheonella factor]
MMDSYTRRLSLALLTGVILFGTGQWPRDAANISIFNAFFHPTTMPIITEF